MPIKPAFGTRDRVKFFKTGRAALADILLSFYFSFISKSCHRCKIILLRITENNDKTNAKIAVLIISFKLRKTKVNPI